MFNSVIENLSYFLYSNAVGSVLYILLKCWKTVLWDLLSGALPCSKQEGFLSFTLMSIFFLHPFTANANFDLRCNLLLLRLPTFSILQQQRKYLRLMHFLLTSLCLLESAVISARTHLRIEPQTISLPFSDATFH